eukprot:PhF_6_TR14911/c0_g1_i1/m.23298
MDVVLKVQDVMSLKNLASTDPKALTAAHPHLLDNIVKTINETLNIKPADEALIAHIISLMSSWSRDTSVAQVLLYGLTVEVAGTLDAFLDTRSELVTLRGGSLDDDMFRDLTMFLYRTCNYRLKGNQFMEVCHHNVTTAMGTLCHVLEACSNVFCQGVEVVEADDVGKLVVAVSRTLLDLSTPAAYFTEDDDTGDVAIEKLNDQFRKYLHLILHAVLNSPLLDYLTYILDLWHQHLCGSTKPSEQLKVRCDVALGNVMSFVVNLLTYTHAYSVKFRQHLSKNSVLIQNVCVPYLDFLLSNLDAGIGISTPSELDVTIRCALHIVRVISFVTYQIKTFRLWVQTKAPIFRKVIESNKIMESPLKVEAFAVVVRLVVNTNDVHSIPTITTNYEKLSMIEKQHLSKRLNSPSEEMYPVNANCETYRQICFIFEGPSDADFTLAQAGEALALITQALFSQPIFGFTFSSQDAPFLFGGWGAPPVSFKGNPAQVVELYDDSDEEGDGKERAGGKALKRNKMKIRAYQTKAHKERQRQKMKARYSNLKGQKVTSIPADDSSSCAQEIEDEGPVLEKNTKTQLEERIIQSASAPPPPPPPPPPAPTPKPVAPQPTNNTQSEQEQQINWDEVTSAVPPEGIPGRYLCALTHQMLITPAVSPNGDVFEKEMIEKYLAAHSNQCPISQSTLSPEDLVVDLELKKEIELWKLRRQLRSTATQPK